MKDYSFYNLSLHFYEINMNEWTNEFKHRKIEFSNNIKVWTQGQTRSRSMMVPDYRNISYHWWPTGFDKVKHHDLQTKKNKIGGNQPMWPKIRMKKTSIIQIFSSKELYKNIQLVIESHQNNTSNLSNKQKKYMHIQLTQHYNHITSK